MNIDINILIIWISGFVKTLGLLIIIFGVVPVMWREARVKDNLIFLRRAIFFSTLLYLLFQLLGFTTLFINPKDVQSIIIIIRNSAYFNILSFLGSLELFTVAVIFYIVYHRHYEE